MQLIINPPKLTRRQFLQAMTVLPLLPWLNNPATADELSGTVFHLQIAQSRVNLKGKASIATTVNGLLPAPTLRWRQGDTVTLHVTNLLNEDTSIHWHGILLPYQMDGVPGISFTGIKPGETFTYQFTVQQTGTYWYHSHSGMQEQTGLYGAIIIAPKEQPLKSFEFDPVLLLSDWTDEDPMVVFAKLKKISAYYNFNQPTVPEFLAAAAQQGLSAALDERSMWNEMRMNPTDLSDISAHTYCYLANGHGPAQPWVCKFKPGQRLLLRFINAGAQTYFDVRIPGLSLTIIEADGQAVEPVTVEEFRIAPAETYAVLITPTEAAYSIFAESMDRTGFALARLTTHDAISAPIPALSKPQPLSMLDMMGDMQSNESNRAHHAFTEEGPSVDMRVDFPRSNLDDPGVGLRNNGRRVLSYADLKSVAGILKSKTVSRELELHLTGNMQRYAWSLDGLEFSESKPIHFHYGESVRVILVNDTMMTHPFHLHGMWCDLENAEQQLQVRKHTISVQPAQRVSFIVNADARGRWAWHCHLFYHMAAGMFREVVVT